MIEKLKSEIEELKRSGRYPSNASYILPALRKAEEIVGYADSEVIKTIAEILEVKPIEVEEAAEFYVMFHTKPRGKHVIRVCTNLSCMLNGGEEVLKRVCEILNVKPGETTEDGLFTVEEFECMGLCDGAPSMTIDDKRFEKVSIEDIPNILKEFGWKG
jgi:NADH-quinone oxidoreductase E subunit